MFSLAGDGLSRHTEYLPDEQRLRGWTCDMLPTDVRQLPSARSGRTLLLRGFEHLFYGSSLSTHAGNENDILGSQELNFSHEHYSICEAPDDKSLAVGHRMRLQAFGHTLPCFDPDE